MVGIHQVGAVEKSVWVAMRKFGPIPQFGGFHSRVTQHYMNSIQYILILVVSLS